MAKVTAAEVAALEGGEGRKGYFQVKDTIGRACYNKAFWLVTWRSGLSEERCTLHTNMVLEFYDKHPDTGIKVTVRRLKKGESIA